MELTTTYKRVFVILVLLLAGWCANAQQYVVVNSVRAFKVPRNTIQNHSYKWEVYKGTDMKPDNRVKLKEIAGEFVVGNTGIESFISSEPKIRWSKNFVKAGDIFTVMLTEINDVSGCNTVVSTQINIVETASSVDFIKPNENYKVVDITRNKIVVPFEFTIDGTEQWKQLMLTKSYERKFKVKFTVTYYSESGSKEIVIDKELDSNLFEFQYDIDNPPFRENNLSDHYFEFKIKSVKDAYDADVKFPTDAVYIFGAYKKPAITRVNHTK